MSRQPSPTPPEQEKLQILYTGCQQPTLMRVRQPDGSMHRIRTTKLGEIIGSPNVTWTNDIVISPTYYSTLHESTEYPFSLSQQKEIPTFNSKSITDIHSKTDFEAKQDNLYLSDMGPSLGWAVNAAKVIPEGTLVTLYSGELVELTTDTASLQQFSSHVVKLPPSNSHIDAMQYRNWGSFMQDLPTPNEIQNTYPFYSDYTFSPDVNSSQILTQNVALAFSAGENKNFAMPHLYATRTIQKNELLGCSYGSRFWDRQPFKRIFFDLNSTPIPSKNYRKVIVAIPPLLSTMADLEQSTGIFHLTELSKFLQQLVKLKPNKDAVNPPLFEFGFYVTHLLLYVLQNYEITLNDANVAANAQEKINKCVIHLNKIITDDSFLQILLINAYKPFKTHTPGDPQLAWNFWATLHHIYCERDSLETIPAHTEKELAYFTATLLLLKRHIPYFKTDYKLDPLVPERPADTHNVEKIISRQIAKLGLLKSPPPAAATTTTLCTSPSVS